MRRDPAVDHDAVALDLSALPDEVRALIAMQEATIARLQAQLAKLRRMQFGRSSERLASSIAQFELALEDLEEQQALTELNDAAPVAPVIGDNGLKPARRPLPEHLPCARLSTIPRRVPVHVAVANSVASERMRPRCWIIGRPRSASSAMCA